MNGKPGIGLIRQEDGSYAWDSGETPSFEWAKQQYYFDRDWYFSSEGSCSGCTPSADDLQYEPKAVVAMIQPRNAAPFQTSNGEIDLTKVSSGYMDYYMSQDELWAVPKSFIIELPGNQSLSEMQTKVDEHLKSASTGAFVNNAILNTWHDLDPLHWLTIQTPRGDSSRRWNWTANLSGNYWGGAGSTLIDAAVSDFTDDFNNIPAEYNPVLDTPAATTYPFVVSAVLTDASGGQPDGARFGNQKRRGRLNSIGTWTRAPSP